MGWNDSMILQHRYRRFRRPPLILTASAEFGGTAFFPSSRESAPPGELTWQVSQWQNVDGPPQRLKDACVSNSTVKQVVGQGFEHRCWKQKLCPGAVPSVRAQTSTLSTDRQMTRGSSRMCGHYKPCHRSCRSVVQIHQHLGHRKTVLQTS